MKTSLFAALALAGLMAAAPAFAHEYKAGELMIGHPWSRPTVPGAKVGAGFFSIENKGSAADRLVSVTVPFAEKVEMHETTMEGDVAKMRPLAEGPEIKPGEKVTFEPGGKHLMFIGLKEPLAQGSRVKGEMTFEKAGKVEVEFAVETPGAKAKDGGMGDMNHMDHGK